MWKEAELSSLRASGRDRAELLSQEMTQSPDLFFGAFEGKRLIGACFGSDDGRKGWLNHLAVHPDSQGQGLAKKLVAAVEKALKARGRQIIGVLVEDWNLGSLEMFRKLGYVVHEDISYLSKRKGKEV